jgi:hypothetical protein
VDPLILLLGGFFVVLAALVQGTLGLGLSLVAAPVVAVLDPSLLPGGMLVLGMFLPAMTMLHEWRSVSWDQAGCLIAARVATTPLGVLLLVSIPVSAIGIVVGCVVLGAVVLTTWRFEVRATRRNLLIAGAVAGVSGTAASIGGPPAVLVLQHEPAARLRATMAAFFLVGSIVSLLALAIGGELTRHQVTYGVLWLPALGIGFGLAVPLQNRVSGPRLRHGVLALAALSSIAAIARSAL